MRNYQVQSEVDRGPGGQSRSIFADRVLSKNTNELKTGRSGRFGLEVSRLRAPLLGVCNWAVSVNRMTLQLGDHGRAQVDTGRLVASSLEDKHVP